MARASSNNNNTTKTALQTVKELTAGTAFSCLASTALTASATTVACDCSQGNFFTLSGLGSLGGTPTLTFSNMVSGQPIWLVVSASGTAQTITFAGTTSTGTLATGTDATKSFVLQFIGVSAASLAEVSRTTAQA